MAAVLGSSGCRTGRGGRRSGQNGVAVALLPRESGLDRLPGVGPVGAHVGIVTRPHDPVDPDEVTVVDPEPSVT